MLLKKKKIPEYITDTIKISYDSDRNDSDEEIPNEENFNEENFDEEN